LIGRLSDPWLSGVNEYFRPSKGFGAGGGGMNDPNFNRLFRWKIWMICDFFEFFKLAMQLMLVGIEDQVFLPADFIICRGDIGNEMYFLREGFAGVFTCHFAKKRGGTSFT